MKNALIVVAAILSLVSGLPYIVNIVRNKTHPNLVSWFTWMIVVTIGAVAAASDGAINTAILSATFALVDLIIIILGIKRGVKRYTLLDISCQLLALVGIILWRLSGDPELAVALASAVILIATIPTLHHAWKAPFEETWQGFAITILADILTILSLPKFSFVALAFPIVSVLNCGSLSSVILSRRKVLRLRTAT